MVDFFIFSMSNQPKKSTQFFTRKKKMSKPVSNKKKQKKIDSFFTGKKKMSKPVSNKKKQKKKKAPKTCNTNTHMQTHKHNS